MFLYFPFGICKISVLPYVITYYSHYSHEFDTDRDFSEDYIIGFMREKDAYKDHYLQILHTFLYTEIFVIHLL